MKPLFEQICGWLDGRGWDYQPESEQQRLILQVEGLTVVVEVSENGEFVKIFLPQLLTLGDDHPHYEAALETLLHLGWQYKLARWQRDPDDGEVRLRADLPLEDSQLTQKQFWRTLEGTLQIAQQGREQLRGVLETGEDSPERTALFEALLQAEMKGGAEAVYQELDQRGGRLDPQLPDAAKTFLQQDHILGNKEIEAAVVGLIENIAISLLEYPRGRREQNVAIAILLYGLVLEARPPERLPDKWAQTQNNLGNAYCDLPTGDRAAHLQRAIKCYEDALTVRKPDTAPLDCLQTARNWANLEFNQGHWQQALNQYQTAIAAIEQSRRGALSESRRQQIIQESIYVYENAIQAAINLDDIPTALEIVERVRAKRLVDLMATADLYADGNIPPQVQEWLQQLDRLDDQIAQKRQEFQDDSGETKPDGLKTRQLRAATAVSADIAEIERQKQDILDQIGGVDEVVAKLRQVQPPKLSDFQPLLSKKTAILNFYTTDDDTHIFILRPGESQPHCFTCKGQGLETLQMWLIKTWMKPYLSDKTQWREQMPDTLAEIAHRLQLNRLITEHLQDMEELVIVPHLFLHQIPFVALPINLSSPTGRGAGGEGYLGDKFLLRYAPSLQVLGFCHHRGPVSMSDYGTAENATDDLPFSGFEGSKVAELFKIDPQRRLIGAAATRQNYRQLLAQVNRLVSTHHAQSRFDNSQESGLKLSDGTISVSQLFSPGWRFPKLDEVFLSCCETGLFSPSSAIDEPVALSTGFLCAGARGLIASQWSIYDCSAALLSILYHEQRQGGLNRVRALQAAQQKMRQMTGAEFKKQYKEPVENHLKAEENRLANHVNHEPLLMGVSDAQRAVKMYANDKGCPFEHPVHWGALGCYGLG